MPKVRHTGRRRRSAGDGRTLAGHHGPTPPPATASSRPVAVRRVGAAARAARGDPRFRTELLGQGPHQLLPAPGSRPRPAALLTRRPTTLGRRRQPELPARLRAVLESRPLLVPRRRPTPRRRDSPRPGRRPGPRHGRRGNTGTRLLPAHPGADGQLEMNGQLDKAQLARVRESVAASPRFELIAENSAGVLLRPETGELRRGASQP
ncbi:hypothetical protein LV779_33790 [Streptomyces thinghirensis]|nr:hypothetical protein [Streptomyces thinghirensis]